MSDSTPPPNPGSSPLTRAFWPSMTAGIALILAALVWYQTRNDIHDLRRDLVHRLGESDQSSKQAQIVDQQTAENLRETNARLAVVESKYADTQNQQIELEALYQDLTRNRDDWVLAEVEQLVIIANQQLQLTGNVQTALSALEAADLRLQKLDKPIMTRLRQTLDRDIDRLRALPYVDTLGIGIRLDTLSGDIDALPLSSDARPHSISTADGTTQGRFDQLIRELLDELAKSIQIKRMDTPEQPLLMPDQSYFLRENLKLRLMSARIDALSRNDQAYQADLKAATVWVKRYFDGDAKTVQNLLSGLKQLSAVSVAAVLPDVNETLLAVQSARGLHQDSHR